MSGDYHIDWLEALSERFDCVFYGPGFPHYSPQSGLAEILADTAPFIPDLMVVATSWDDDESEESVDPNPRVDFSVTEIPTVYFLNKDYKKLDQRIYFAERNRFDVVLTTNPRHIEWSLGRYSRYQHLEFGVNLERFSAVSEGGSRNVDLFFSGGLHRQYTDERVKFKEALFRGEHLNRLSNITPLKKPSNRMLTPEVSGIGVYWAEWGAKDFFGRTLVPTGRAYVRMLRSSHIGFNTLSANETLNTRFYEQMAAGNVVLAPGPESKYRGLLTHMENALIYPQDNAFEGIELILDVLNDRKLISGIRENARQAVRAHSYAERVRFLENFLEELGFI